MTVYKYIKRDRERGKREKEPENDRQSKEKDKTCRGAYMLTHF